MSDHIKEAARSAFPYPPSSASSQLGLTLREYAAITLRVPESGHDWLDAMIHKANTRDAAVKALAGMLASETDESSYQPDAAASRARTMAEHLMVEVDGDYDEIV